MGKKARIKAAEGRRDGIGPRQPCPCGSGRRYKACHGSADGSAPYVVRTFAGLPGECDWVAMREFVPTAVAPLALRDGAFDGAGDGRSVEVATVLPGIAPAVVRSNTQVRLALQIAHQSADPSQDLAHALGLALQAAPGDSVVMTQLPGSGPRLQDVVDPASPFVVTVFDGYDFWFDDVERENPKVTAMLENLAASVKPTIRLTGVDAAYWTSVGTKEHLRWVLPHDEERLLSALARLHASGADHVGVESRLVGSFRAHGLLVPVWDLPVGTGAEALEPFAAHFEQRLGEALNDTSPLTVEERSARNGLANRQVTIR